MRKLKGQHLRGGLRAAGGLLQAVLRVEVSGMELIGLSGLVPSARIALLRISLENTLEIMDGILQGLAVILSNMKRIGRLKLYTAGGQ